MQIAKPDPVDTAKGVIPLLLLIGGLTAISLFGLYSCINELQTGGPLSEREKYFHENAVRATSSDKDTISIRSLTNFQWDRVCYSIPYERQGDVEKKTGVSLPGFHDAVKWADHEGFWTLLFTGPSQGFVAIRVPRVAIADYPHSTDDSRICVRAKNGIFKVVPVTLCAGCSTRRFVLRAE